MDVTVLEILSFAMVRLRYYDMNPPQEWDFQERIEQNVN
jgi:hypothetical protein